MHFDIIVVGGGHAGCEAAHAAASMGKSTLLITMSLDNIGKMSCNPSIGGVGKGQIVREVDALGGIMGKAADRTAIHYTMLNLSKGPAVRSPRCQCDKYLYSHEVKYLLESTNNLRLMEGHVKGILIHGDRISGITTADGSIYHANSLIISSGTFLKGSIYIGMERYSSGRAGEPASSLSTALSKMGFKLGKLKTGTPPRVDGSSIDYSSLEEQQTKEGIRMSHSNEKRIASSYISCWKSHTTSKTMEIFRDNISLSPLGTIVSSKGPRYCPSFEEKTIRFPDRESQKIFLSLEGLRTHEVYVNGFSTSLPPTIQEKALRSIIGLEDVKMTRAGYTIEYEYVIAGSIKKTLETKSIENLYFAGQINGTTGYEEAAGQGIIAGINAALKIDGREPFIPHPHESYIGLMIDDITNKVFTEPYRIFTSRSHNRLYLRQDNADLRLSAYGYKLGLIPKERHERIKRKAASIKMAIKQLSQERLDGKTLLSILSQHNISYRDLLKKYPIKDFGDGVNEQVEIYAKYQYYMNKGENFLKEYKKMSGVKIPENFDYDSIQLKNECKELLKKRSPNNLGELSSLAGVTFEDLSKIMISLKRES